MYICSKCKNEVEVKDDGKVIKTCDCNESIIVILEAKVKGLSSF